LSAALITGDGWVMLGRRNASVAYYPNRIHPFAGSLEPGDLSNVFGGVQRELREELQLTKTDIAELRCLGVVEDARLAQPEIIFAAKSTRRRDEIELMLDDAEHHACVAVEVEPDRVTTLMRDARLTPVAVGTLLLWGRIAFGEAWFETTRSRFARDL
jgi:8-oxo-dGTP pyrophosphatase MutT (NUDIX family)